MGTFTTTTDATNVAVAYNWVIRPDLMNELRGGWTRANFNYTYPQALQGNSIISRLGITGLPGPPKNGLGGVPVFYVGQPPRRRHEPIWAPTHQWQRDFRVRR